MKCSDTGRALGRRGRSDQPLTISSPWGLCSVPSPTRGQIRAPAPHPGDLKTKDSGCSWQNWKSKRFSSPYALTINRKGRGGRGRRIKEKAAWSRGFIKKSWKDREKRKLRKVDRMLELPPTPLASVRREGGSQDMCRRGWWRGLYTRFNGQS